MGSNPTLSASPLYADFFILMKSIIEKLNNSNAIAFSYILKSEKDNGIYIGSTKDLKDRYLNQHQKGKIKSTKSRRPLALIYFEEFDDYKKEYSNETAKELPFQVQYFAEWIEEKFLDYSSRSSDLDINSDTASSPILKSLIQFRQKFLWLKKTQINHF